MTHYFPSSRRGAALPWILCALAAGALGCRRGPASSAAPPPTLVSRCGGGATANSLPMNSLPMNSLPMNGLRHGALEQQQALIAALVTHPLSPELFADPDRAALLSDGAADLTAYVVSCALDPCEWVDAPATVPADQAARLVDKADLTGVAADRGVKVFAGELGLCSGRYAAQSRRAAPSGFRWSATAPAQVAASGWQLVDGSDGQACLERVTACLLARTNAVDARVPISLRGDGTELSKRVPVNTMFRAHRGTPILSFGPCASPAIGDPRRNCGWQPHYVGQCAAGERVRVAADAPFAVEVRLCAGVYGCDSDASPRTALPGGNPPFYSGGELAQLGPGEFVCPDNGPLVDGMATGYFGVMYRPRDGGARRPDELTVRVASSNPAGGLPRYPASEAQVFAYREGSFYGNLFVPMPPRPEIVAPEVDGRMLSDDQFACYSDQWSPDGAMLSHRLCAGPSAALPEGCFGNPPGPCDARAAEPSSCPPGPPCPLSVPRAVPGQCSVGADPSVAAVCRSQEGGTRPLRWAPEARAWQHPLTTYLNHPCDLSPDVATCVGDLAAPIRERVRAQFVRP